MYGPYQGRARLFRRRGLAPRMVMSEDWEVFASILLKSTGTTSRAGPDLGDHEVKSAVDGSSFEYQYHRKSWQGKLAADREAGHVFIWHRDELSLERGDIAGFAAELHADQVDGPPPVPVFLRVAPFLRLR